MSDKIKICINMPNKQKTSKYAKTSKIRLHIFNRGTLKWISMSSIIKYNLSRFICKCMNSRALIINIIVFSLFLKTLAISSFNFENIGMVELLNSVQKFNFFSGTY